MPATLASFRVPTSVSRNGTCKTNLRGIGNATGFIYDYAYSSNIGNINAFDIASVGVSASGAGTWSNQIRFAYANTSNQATSYIQYNTPKMLSDSGVIFMRLQVSSAADSNLSNQCIFVNGTEGVNGYGIVTSYIPGGRDAGFKIFFTRLDDPSLADNIQISAANVVTDKWYSYSLRFETDSGSASTKITSYEDGILTQSNAPLTGYVLPPSGFAFLFSAGASINLTKFTGQITDFAVVEDTTITNPQLADFKTAPYI